MDSPKELKEKIYHHILSNKYSSLDQTEKEIFKILFELENGGITMPQLMERLGRRVRDSKQEEERLRTRISTLRKKLNLFFATAGKLYALQCTLPELKRGRLPRKPYRLIWKENRILAEATGEYAQGSSSVIESQIAKSLIDLALAKLHKDFDYSALKKGELLESAFKYVFEEIDFLVAINDERPVESRIQREIALAELTRLPIIPSNPAVASVDISVSCQAVINYAIHNNVIVNNECIEVASLATLLSCRKKYGLGVNILQEDQSGRQVVWRLNSDDSADFVFAPIAPFFLHGTDKALNYRLVLPIHAEDQVLLRKSGKRRHKNPTILVYSDSSAQEQYFNMKQNRKQRSIWGKLNPWTNEILDEVKRSKPMFVHSLEEIIQFSKALLPGDFVIAWQPLSDGLQRNDRSLIAVSKPFQHWLALFAHKRWFEDSLTALRRDFLRMFIFEWRVCNRFRLEWAWPLASHDEDFRDYFGGGAGADLSDEDT